MLILGCWKEKILEKRVLLCSDNLCLEYGALGFDQYDICHCILAIVPGPPPTYTNKLYEWLVIAIKDNIGYLKNEPQTMMTFVLKVQPHSPITKFRLVINPSTKAMVYTKLDKPSP